MYDWNSRANYQAATKEYHAHMSKMAKKLNSVVGELEGSYKVWNKILKKHKQIQENRQIDDRELIKKFTDYIDIPKEITNEKKSLKFNNFLRKLSIVSRKII